MTTKITFVREENILSGGGGGGGKNQRELEKRITLLQ